MAYIKPGREDEENQANQPGQEAPATQENVVSSAGGVIGGGQSGQSSGTAAPGQGGRKPFTNLQSYLGANEGENAQRMGNEVQGFAENQVGQARQAKQETQNQFQQQKQDNTVQLDQTFVDELRKDPTQLTKDPGRVQSFQRQMNASYQGPRSLTDIQGFDNVAQQYNRASGTLRNLQSDEGTGQVLRETYQRPDYTRGQNTLDSFIVRGDQGSRQTLRGMADRFKGISGLVGNTPQELANAQQQATTQAQQAQATTDATRNTLRSAFDQARTGVVDQVTGLEQQAAQTEAQKQTTRDLFANNDRATVLSVTGMAPEAYDFIVSQGLDPSMFVTPTAAMTAGDLASADLRSQIEALQTLGNEQFGLNLTPGGGSASAFNVASDRIGTLNQGAPVVSNVQQDFAQQQTALQQRNADLMNRLTGDSPREQELALAEIGASPELLNEMRGLGFSGPEVVQYVQEAARQGTHGDLLSDAEISSLQNLQNMFGTDFGLDLSRGSGSTAPTINENALKAALTKRKQERVSGLRNAAAAGDENTRQLLGVTPMAWDLGRSYGLNPADYIAPNEFGKQQWFNFDTAGYMRDFNQALNQATAEAGMRGQVDPITSWVMQNPDRTKTPTRITPIPQPEVKGVTVNPNVPDFSTPLPKA